MSSASTAPHLSQVPSRLPWGLGRACRALACTTGALFITALLPLAGQDRPREIRIGVASVGVGGRPYTGGGYPSIAADTKALENEFARDGIKVRYTYYQGAGPTINECLANRQLDFAFQGDLPALVARAGGLPTKLIMATDRFGAIFIAVRADSPFHRLEDLKGKRIALFKGTNLQMAFWNLLASKGLKESDFRVINMGTFEGDAALLAKDVDAQVSYNDLVPMVESRQARIIYSTHADRKLGRLSHLLVTEGFAARYPALVQRVVNTLLKSAAWQADEKNRTQAYRIWSKSGLGISAWKYEFDDYALKERCSPLFDPFYRAQYKRLLKLAREQRLVRKDFDVDAWLDGSYIAQGILALRLQNVWRELDSEGRPK